MLLSNAPPLLMGWWGWREKLSAPQAGLGLVQVLDSRSRPHPSEAEQEE